MKILKFKTNIENKQMKSKIAPLLDKEELISQWKLDLESPERILNVSGEHITSDIIINALSNAGVKAEMIQVLAIGGDDL